MSRDRAPAALLAAAALAGAVALRFLQDDAFIAFHYARNLAEGKGLTWFGARVEGYTDFLWVLWLALWARLGAAPELVAQVSGLLCFALALAAVARLARGLGAHPWLVPLALVIFAGQYTALAYATGGLETMAQAAALAWLALLAGPSGAPAPGPKRAVCLSLLAAGSVLLRPDSALLALLVLGPLCLRCGGRARAALVTPAAFVLGAWVLWKLHYYGALLPNTAVAKLADPLPLRLASGLLYLGRYLQAYWLWPFLAAALLFALNPRCDRNFRRLLLLVLAWYAYVAASGGDFMEFRFLVPIWPLAAALIARLLLVELGGFLCAPRLTAAGGALALGTASLLHGLSFRGTTADYALDSIPQLASFYGLAPDGDFARLGRALARDLAGLDLRLAMHPVGAIPYYSRLETVDMWGLTDPWVARHGNPVPPDFHRPGHRRHAPLSYLRRRGVHLILGHPLVAGAGALSNPLFTPERAALIARDMVRYEPHMPREVDFVELPLGRGRVLLAWYLTPLPALSRRIAARGWARRRFRLPSR